MEIQSHPDQLRFITCGSVDDGKSTLMGRLLYECGAVLTDQLDTLRRESARHGTNGEEYDFALLLDGLEAEREQAITIDVAYRYFKTPHRSFIAIDCPGHEQYTRNMATGASQADLAVILVDARKGLGIQARRHATLCSLLGVRQVVLAVNKMDLVAYDKTVFDRIAAEFGNFAGSLHFDVLTAIPLSARCGDNVTRPSAVMAWSGVTLLSALESARPASPPFASFRFPVQLVLRPTPDFRGLAGTVVAGRVRVGDEIVVTASGTKANVAGIRGATGDQGAATAGEAVVLTLDRELDVARGDLIASPLGRPSLADQFTAHLVWMSDQPCRPGRQYMMRLATSWTPVVVSRTKHRLSVDKLEKLAAHELGLNEIGLVDIAASTTVAFDRYADCRSTGAFILVDKQSNATVGMGMIEHPLRRALNVHLEPALIGKSARAAAKEQEPCCVWLTGLSGSGKSTVAKELEQALHLVGKHTMLLDGDNLRHGLNRNLGFTETDRVENIRRAGEVAKLMTEAGLIVICAFISPFRADRAMARSMFPEGEFLEVFVDTPLEECIRRDSKGLYAKALRGEIPNFTGVSSPYEKPESAELRLSFDPAQGKAAIAAHVSRIMEALGV